MTTRELLERIAQELYDKSAAELSADEMTAIQGRLAELLPTGWAGLGRDDD